MWHGGELTRRLGFGRACRCRGGCPPCKLVPAPCARGAARAAFTRGLPRDLGLEHSHSARGSPGAARDDRLVPAPAALSQVPGLGLRIDTTRLDLTYKSKYEAHLPGEGERGTQVARGTSIQAAHCCCQPLAYRLREACGGARQRGASRRGPLAGSCTAASDANSLRHVPAVPLPWPPCQRNLPQPEPPPPPPLQTRTSASSWTASTATAGCSSATTSSRWPGRSSRPCSRCARAVAGGNCGWGDVRLGQEAGVAGRHVAGSRLLRSCCPSSDWHNSAFCSASKLGAAGLPPSLPTSPTPRPRLPRPRRRLSSAACSRSCTPTARAAPWARTTWPPSTACAGETWGTTSERPQARQRQ